MKKLLVSFIIFIGFTNLTYADIRFNIEIHNVIINGGRIYVGIYFNETAYRNTKQDMILQFESTNDIIIAEINLPEGEYVMDAYQDTNNNNKCDLGLFNIPKEPIGMTNYNGGIPGNFNKLKVIINNETGNIIINLYSF
jgi:uncharacterized protein (DUF2141 family)